MPPRKLKASFKRVDMLRAKLAKAEADLRRDVQTYCDEQNLLIRPRLETIRAQLR